MEPNEFDSILFGAKYAKHQYAYSDELILKRLDILSLFLTLLQYINIVV